MSSRLAWASEPDFVSRKEIRKKALKRMRQENYHKFRATLGHRVISKIKEQGYIECMLSMYKYGRKREVAREGDIERVSEGRRLKILKSFELLKYLSEQHNLEWKF